MERIRARCTRRSRSPQGDARDHNRGGAAAKAMVLQAAAQDDDLIAEDGIADTVVVAIVADLARLAGGVA